MRAACPTPFSGFQRLPDGGAVLSLGLGLPLLFALLSVPAFIAALAILANGHARRRVSRALLAH